MSRWEKAKKKVETTTTLLRLLVVGGSAYLLYQKFKKEDPDADLLDIAQSRIRNSVGSATTPLAAPTNEPLPVTNQPQQMAYGQASPDQKSTTQSLQTPSPTRLSPEELASQALQSGASWLQSNLVSA